MKFFLVALTLLVSINPAFEWKTLDTTEYSIKYPDSWELNQSGASGTKFLIFSPLVPSASFRDNINLVIEDLKGKNITLEQYTEFSTGQLKQFLTDFVVHESVTKDGRHRLVYTGSHSGLHLKWEQYYWIKNEKAYVLTFTALKDSFDGRLEIVHQMADSFSIK